MISLVLGGLRQPPSTTLSLALSMRIKLLISVGGTTFSHVPGDIVDWPEDAARAHIAEGYAEAVVEPAAEKPAAKPSKKA